MIPLHVSMELDAPTASLDQPVIVRLVTQVDFIALSSNIFHSYRKTTNFVAFLNSHLLQFKHKTV